MTIYVDVDRGIRDRGKPVCGSCDRPIVFRLKHFVPAHADAFVPPADNPQSHNNRSKPGYDPRCQPAAKIPARFYLVCECGQGWYRDALESDLRARPLMIANEVAKAIHALIYEKISDPAMRYGAVNVAYREALRELTTIGLPELLGEIPAAGASDIEQKFVAQFMQPMAAAPPELRRSTSQSPKE